MTAPQRPMLSFSLSDEEQQAAVHCMFVLNTTLRQLMILGAPALALLVATLDTVSDAGDRLAHLAGQQGPEQSVTAYRAIHEALEILMAYFDAQQRSVLFESDVETPLSKNQIN